MKIYLIQLTTTYTIKKGERAGQVDTFVSYLEYVLMQRPFVGVHVSDPEKGMLLTWTEALKIARLKPTYTIVNKSQL